jgi:hypothetical protein
MVCNREIQKIINKERTLLSLHLAKMENGKMGEG